MSHPNPLQINMSTFLEEPENERVQQPKRAIDVLRKWISYQVTPPDRLHSGSTANFGGVDLSLLRMPHTPEDEPPLAKYRRVEINTAINSPGSVPSMEMRPQLFYSNIERMVEMGSTESPINGQPIPGDSLALESEPTNCSLNEPKPQLLDEVIVIENSSDEDVAASYSISREICPKLKYFFMKLRIDDCEFARDCYVGNLQLKIARREKRLDDKRSILKSQIEKLRNARKAFDQKRLDAIIQFQFQCPKCPPTE